MAGSAKPTQAKSLVGRKRNREEFQKRLAEAVAQRAAIGIEYAILRIRR